MKVALASALALICMGGWAAAQAPAAPAAQAAPAAPAKAAAAKPAVKPAAKPKGKAAAPAPAPVVAAAPVIMEPLAKSVQAYAAFQSDIDLVNGGSIQESKDIERALDKAAAINRDELTRGFIAYGALTAARNEEFVQEIRKTAGFYGKDRILKALLNNSNYAGTIKGGDKATEYIIRAAAADTARVMTAGESLKQRAREAQNLKWGKALSGAAAPRLKRLRTAADGYSSSFNPALADRLKIVPGAGDPALDRVTLGGDSFWRALAAKPGEEATLTALPAQVQSFNWTTTTGGASIRGSMLSLAAMYALDATMDQPAATETVLNNKLTNNCLQGAQLTFYQCVASAHFNYENMACVGEAGLMTVGSCFQDATK
jgi:hypothetical protein